LMTVAFVLVSAGAGNAYAARTLTTKTDRAVTRSVPQEEVKKMKGVVVKREPDAFTMSETTGGPQTTVLLTEKTEVKSHKKGVFRGSKEYAASYILRGLRLEVDGTRNADGQIVADKIRFDEQDLRTAQALKATLDPVEAEAQENLKKQQAENERLAGQIEENRALTAQAQASAEAAAEADRRGWVMAVIGYADTTGNSARNIDLSERRANAVIFYIVTKYKMPLNRLVQ